MNWSEYPKLMSDKLEVFRRLTKPKRTKIKYERVSSCCVILNNVLYVQVDESEDRQAGVIRIYKDGTRRFTSNSMH